MQSSGPIDFTDRLDCNREGKFPTHMIVTLRAGIVVLHPLNSRRLDLNLNGLRAMELLVGVDGDPIAVDSDPPLPIPFRVAEEVIQRAPPPVPAVAALGDGVGREIVPVGEGPAPEEVGGREGFCVVGTGGSFKLRGARRRGRRNRGGGDGVADGGGRREGGAVGEGDVVASAVVVGVVLGEVIVVVLGGRHGCGIGAND